MNIKQKLMLILHRITFFHSQSNFSEDYNKGFKHALDLFSIAMKMEFGKWCEDQENLQEQIRQLKVQLKDANGKISSQNHEINRLKSQPRYFLNLPNNQLSGLINQISKITGLSFGRVKNLLNEGVKIDRQHLTKKHS
ncbi:hypothetical protein [Sphingobacterium thalpophilum]|uniref:hypothetical protein n=1 Tax=Sphingobacterium thalpophilum TaxID=259 RepID=UPI0024A6D391|nr:hypothetical protein [Sphingobacterium thalpophilum]